MKKAFFSILVLFGWVCSNAQNNSTDTVKVKKSDIDTLPNQIKEDVAMPTFIQIDKSPEYPGGQDSMMKFIMENLVYPPLAIENDVEGTVLIRFVVEKDGHISNVKPIGKKIFGFGLEQESIRVVKLMPRWKPGESNRKPIRTHISLPIIFKLE